MFISVLWYSVSYHIQTGFASGPLLKHMMHELLHIAVNKLY